MQFPYGNLAKRKLAAKEPIFAFAVRTLRTVDVAPISSALGYDMFYVDFQHSAIDVDVCRQMCQAGLLAGITPLFRPPSLDSGLIGRCMDGGAMGVLAADINTASDARALADAALLYPMGRRSIGTGVPNLRFQDVPATELTRRINEETLLIAMLETPQAIENAGEIADVDGIDALMIGTNDLSLSMGVSRQFDHPLVVDAYAAAIDACTKRGKSLLMGGIRSEELYRRYIRMGAARVYMTGVDTAFLIDGARRQYELTRKIDQGINAK